MEEVDQWVPGLRDHGDEIALVSRVVLLLGIDRVLSISREPVVDIPCLVVRGRLHGL